MTEMKVPGRLSLRALWQKLKGRKEKVPQPKRPPLKETRSIEPLERRIAPASLIDASTLIYKDLEGDTVTVKFSQPIFDPASPALNALLEGVFTFSAGDSHSGTDTPQQLQLIDLSKAPVIGFKNVAAGTSLSITAEKTGGSGD